MKKYIKESLQIENHSYVSNDYPIDCSLGSNPFGAPKNSVDWLRNFNGEGISEYFNFSVIVDLTMMIAKFTGFRGENIFVGNGSYNCLSILFFKFFNARKNKMLGVGPQFVDATTEWKLAGGEYTSIPLNLCGTKKVLPIERIEAELRSGDFACMYIDNPNNPLGYSYELNDLEAVAKICEETDTFFLIDEAYGDYIDIKNSGINLIDKYSNIFVTRSFSKGFGLASIRTGYLCVSDEYLGAFRKIFPPFTPSFVGAKLATKALEDTSFIDTNISRVRENKKEMISMFERNGISVLPTHPDVPIFTIYEKDVDLFGKLSLLNIITESGAHFTVTNNLFNSSYCRVKIPANIFDIQHINHRLSSLR